MVQQITIRRMPEGASLPITKSTVASLLDTTANNFGDIMNRNSDLFPERGQKAAPGERARVTEMNEAQFVTLFARLRTRGRTDRGITFANVDGRMKVSAAGGEVLLDMEYNDAMELIQKDILG